jgi:hypothetical protein
VSELTAAAAASQQQGCEFWHHLHMRMEYTHQVAINQSINQCYTCSYEAQKAHASHSLASMTAAA